MMSQEQNDLITRTGAKDPCGKLMRMYWQPGANPGNAAGAEGPAAVKGDKTARLSRGREKRNPLGLSRRRRAAGISGNRLLCGARQPHFRVQGPYQLQLAAGARRRHRSV